MNDVEILKRYLEREKKARKQAESILEEKALELYKANDSLRKLNESLEDQVKKRTAELEESELNYRNVVDQATDIIYSTDEEGYFTFINPKGVEAFGYKAEDIIGQRYIDFVTDDHKADLFEYYTSLRDLGTLNDYFEFPIKSRDGSVHWIGQNVYRVDRADGSFYFNAVARDITLRKQTEKELEIQTRKAEKAKKAEQMFLANMSHEIRTPLNAIIGMSHLLKDSSLNEDQREYIDILFNSASLLKGLVSDILDISKIDAEEVEATITKFKFDDFLNVLLQPFAIQAKENNIELEHQYFISEDLLCTDKQWLNQILINLLSNAIKFTKEGKVVFTVKSLGKSDGKQSIYFEVKDSGVGISKTNLKNIFSAFKQANRNVRKDFGGTGLGLAIASKLVALLGGKLEVESEKNIGSTFYFTLDIQCETCAREGNTIDPMILDNPSEQNHLLIVEDNKMNQKYISALLQKWNIRFDIAENGLEATEIFKPGRYSMVFMDLSMPVMDGYKATEIIRKQDQHIPIIALTASTFLSKKELALNSGMSDFLAKPFIPVDLKNLILKYSVSTQVELVRDQDMDINNDELMALYDGDVDHINMMMHAYMETIGGELQLLNEAVESGVSKVIQKQLHKMKPMFSMVGFSTLTNRVGQLEKEWEKNNHQNLNREIKSLSDDIEKTIEKVKTYISHK